jgi:hypothetical protein
LLTARQQHSAQYNKQYTEGTVNKNIIILQNTVQSKYYSLQNNIKMDIKGKSVHFIFMYPKPDVK